VYARHNGHFLLEVTAHPRFGLPYGQDRLIPIRVATLAVLQKSRLVHFESAAQILEFFHLPKDGPHYPRMVEAFQRRAWHYSRASLEVYDGRANTSLKRR
jgi:hypothetical protein